MAQTYTHLLSHIIFSTKDRRPLMTAQCKPRLIAYMGGIVRELKGNPLIIDGTADHLHMLIQLPPTLPLAHALRVVKANSSRWLREQWPSQKQFAWQGGYGAFSVSRSNIRQVIAYIENQEEHHRRRSFQEEFIALLKQHGVEYDERYIWT